MRYHITGVLEFNAGPREVSHGHADDLVEAMIRGAAVADGTGLHWIPTSETGWSLLSDQGDTGIRISDEGGNES